MITDTASFNIPYTLSDFNENKVLRVGSSSFSSSGIKLRVNNNDISLNGILRYHKLTPINGDIMGPFRYFPMECRHGVVSMKHNVCGEIELNGEKWDFSSGTGYIETDSGFSFPETYTWIQSNDFKANCSIMAAIAKIPFSGFHFWGCICVVWLNGKEYRLATYKGAKIHQCAHNVIELRQGKYKLTIKANQQNTHNLDAPQTGIMSRVIKESASCPAKFHFTEGSNTIFYGESRYASYEYVKGISKT